VFTPWPIGNMTHSFSGRAGPLSTIPFAARVSPYWKVSVRPCKNFSLSTFSIDGCLPPRHCGMVL
jgi:hypothetical protein